MIIATPFESAFYILAGIHPEPVATKEDAYQALKRMTDQDFGYDLVAWLEYGMREGFCIHLDEGYLARFKQQWNENKSEEHLADFKQRWVEDEDNK